MTMAIRPPVSGRGSASWFESSGRRAQIPDDYLDAVAKLVPGDIMVGFVAALQLPGLGQWVAAHVAVMVALALLVPVGLWRSSRRAEVVAPPLQYVVRTAIFGLFAVGVDRTLAESVGVPSWILASAVMPIAALAALVFVPPGSASHCGERDDRLGSDEQEPTR